MCSLKRTPLFEEHRKLGAKIVPFAGWEMPIQYSGIIDEHNTVRTKVGLFDVSHMGEFFIWGEEALDLLQKLVPQDISKLQTEKAIYSQLINKDGGIIDDLIIYKLPDKENHPHFLLIVNASRIEEDFNWITFNAKKEEFKVEIENKSDNLAMLAIQGPEASSLIQEMGLNKPEQPVRFSIKETKLNSYEVLISRTGYTGEDGFEIVVENDKAPELWQTILNKGQAFGLKPIGLGARDTLRLEAAMLLYGQDMNEKITPVEASLSWSVSRDKLEEYYGKDIILNQLNNDQASKVLVGFRMLDRSIPRHDYEVFKDNQKVGIVTSGGISPTLGTNIGLAYLDKSVSTSIGTKFDVKIRDKFHPAEVIKRPFYVKK